MRTICPRCGVTSKDDAEFCVSCGQPLKSAVSSIPPSKVGVARTPISEVNVHKVVEDNSSSVAHQGTRRAEVSVRYRTISTNPEPPETVAPEAGTGAGGGITPDNFRETILLHAPTARLHEPERVTEQQSVNPETVRVQTATPHMGGAEQKDPQLESLRTVDSSAPLTKIVKARSLNLLKNTGEAPSLQIQHIWYKITANSDWNTVALVPASDDVELMKLAHGLGAMAVREPCEFVRVVNASPGASAAEKKKNVDDETGSSSYPYEYFDLVEQLQPEADSASVAHLTKELLTQFDKARAAGNLRDGKVFVSIDSIISHPDAIAVCRAVDRVIICVGLGKTKFGAVKKIVETIGRDKVLGCVSMNCQ